MRKPTLVRPLYLTNDIFFADQHRPDPGLADGTLLVLQLVDTTRVFDLKARKDVMRLDVPEWMKTELRARPQFWGVIRYSEDENGRYIFKDALQLAIWSKDYVEENGQPSEKIRETADWLRRNFNRQKLYQLYEYSRDNPYYYKLHVYTIASKIYEQIMRMGYGAVLSLEGEYDTLVVLDGKLVKYAFNFNRALTAPESELLLDAAEERKNGKFAESEIKRFLQGLDVKKPLTWEEYRAMAGYD